ncbi:hypothetical protein B4U79_08707 [Dinothrombium tinctorium]|uniref:NADH dehydrogenase [ubiquinone] 1 alpha subcomplex subunit 5 n=1 Tax=Dinothrombium tinctorium TaxID=1965070 RepID=A0A3S3PLD8_9ACAR|nr:hypothetical protein B4U79_14506 [Dinothrombium tinctorium]RWS02611.1 hypothetical protein B4U79_15643 [Dinothrombium tinctorium]RWS03067.1 hypothetical protein B4U79_13244 [Dinothrombium tinctorium]RWS03803.1 hypothetical protein B4U79_08707 [Dinothrombium tinctorium]
MSKVVKTLTGLTGLEVARTPHYTLTQLYLKIKNSLSQMPPDAAYRKYTEKIIDERLKVVQNEPDVEKIEKKIDCGQVEELIIQAENELRLARKMNEWKPWEPLCEQAPANQWKWP